MTVLNVSVEQLSKELNQLEVYARHKQASSTEAQKAFSAWVVQLENYLTQQQNETLDTEDYKEFCKRIIRLDSNYVLSSSLQHKVCEVMNRIFPKASPSMFNWNTVYGTVETMVKSCLGISETLKGLFVDGQSGWKQQKYQLVLEAILKAFSTDPLFFADIKEIYQNLKKLEQRSAIQQLVLDCFVPLIEPSQDYRASYRQFIDAIRTAFNHPIFIHEKKLALEGMKYDTDINYIMQACYYRFAEVHLYGFCNNLIEMILNEGVKTLKEQDEREKEDIFALPLTEQFKAIHAVSLTLKEPQTWGLMQRASAGTNIYYDPQRKSNIPYVLCHLVTHQSQPLTILRMGTPTISFTHVNPEFKLFLTSCVLKNKKFLYVSSQAEDWLVESSRNHLLKELTHEFPDHFFLVILSKDSPFYHQSGNQAQPYQIAEVFIKEFLEQLISSQQGCFFDETWLADSGFKERLNNCLQEVHKDIFNDERILSRQQRLDFIEIAYARLILEIMHYLKLDHKAIIDFLCVACRDCNDRAVITLTILTALSLHYLGKYYRPEYQRMLKVFIHAPKMLVMKEEMNMRRERLITALETMEKPDIMINLRLRQQYSHVVKDLILESVQ